MLAMLDYPYPASFLAKLPANPVNVSCQILLDATDKLRGLADAAGNYEVWLTISSHSIVYRITVQWYKWYIIMLWYW